VAIPDGAGHTLRSRAAAYLSGTGQIILADAGNYWSKGSLDAEIKTAWLYAIWDGTGIVWALAGYSGFHMVPTTVTATDDDYFLLEASSTYTRSNAHYCVAVAKIRYQYDTADTPDHTIQATVENAPQVIWNPKSDYGMSLPLATGLTSPLNIPDQAIVFHAVKQPGLYEVSSAVMYQAGTNGSLELKISTGSSTYGSATVKYHSIDSAASFPSAKSIGGAPVSVYLNTVDTIHLGVAVGSSDSNRIVYGVSDGYIGTVLHFRRVD